MKTRTLLLFLIIWQSLYAQNQTDTLQLPVIEILALQELTTMPFETFDSLQNRFETLTHIGQFLNLNPSVFVREYSASGIMTISFLGTSSQHARLQVNGFPFDVAMSSQPDLHHAPAFLFDVLNVISSPKALFHTHDAVGGLILLASKPDTSNNLDVRLRTQTGSFHTHALGGSISFRKKQFFSRTMGIWQTSENNYPYVNNTLPDRPIERRVNAGYTIHHVAQENAVYHNNFSLHNYLLYSSLLQELPASLWSAQMDKNEIMQQQMLNNFTTLRYEQDRTSYELGIHSGLQDWTYSNKSLNIQSLNKVQTVRLQAANNFSPNKNVLLSNQLFINHQQVKSNNYASTKSVTLSGLRTQLQLDWTRYRFLTAIHLLYHHVKGFHFSGMFGWDVRATDKTELALHAGQSIRFPSLNELYWNPGGNPSLKPELGQHVSFTIKQKMLKNVEVFFLTNHSLVNNWILWQPTQNISIWSPANVRKVYCQTYETGINFNRTIQKLFVRWTLAGSLIRSLDVSDRNLPAYQKQLIYVPLYQASSFLTLRFAFLKLQFQSTYTGKRFTSYDNTSYLPAYFQHHCTISLTGNIKKTHLTVFMNIWNITNENYQVVAWYPMPRRHYAIGIQFNL